MESNKKLDLDSLAPQALPTLRILPVIHDRVDISPFKAHLLSGNFGLISLPLDYRKHLVVGDGIEV